MKRTFLLFLACLTMSVCLSHHWWCFRVMEWNCENLFDTLHDAGRQDTAFLPQGEYRWNTPRYHRKLSDMARTILDAGGLQAVDVVGLCEVENDSVIRDLIRRTRLAHLDYEYVMTDSPDARGIDVALLYQPLTFHLLSHSSHNVSMPDHPTRDLLLCTGLTPVGDTLDIVLLHLPSRRGGARASAPRRLHAARAVRSIADSLLQVHRSAGPNPQHDRSLIVMGDCNDEPTDASLRLMAQDDLVNVSAHAAADDRHIRGTYFYQGAWSRIDNILVSTALSATPGPDTDRCRIFAPDYLLEVNSQGVPMPFRTYRGPAYHGGVSDHLPLLYDFFY